MLRRAARRPAEENPVCTPTSPTSLGRGTIVPCSPVTMDLDLKVLRVSSAPPHLNTETILGGRRSAYEAKAKPPIPKEKQIRDKTTDSEIPRCDRGESRDLVFFPLSSLEYGRTLDACERILLLRSMTLFYRRSRSRRRLLGLEDADSLLSSRILNQ